MSNTLTPMTNDEQDILYQTLSASTPTMIGMYLKDLKEKGKDVSHAINQPHTYEGKRYGNALEFICDKRRFNLPQCVDNMLDNGAKVTKQSLISFRTQMNHDGYFNLKKSPETRKTFINMLRKFQQTNPEEAKAYMATLPADEVALLKQEGPDLSFTPPQQTSPHGQSSPSTTPQNQPSPTPGQNNPRPAVTPTPSNKKPVKNTTTQNKKPTQSMDENNAQSPQKDWWSRSTFGIPNWLLLSIVTGGIGFFFYLAFKEGGWFNKSDEPTTPRYGPSPETSDTLSQSHERSTQGLNRSPVKTGANAKLNTVAKNITPYSKSGGQTPPQSRSISR